MILLVVLWAAGCGYLGHDSVWREWFLIPFWPIVVPIGWLYHGYHYGFRSRRFVYINTRWWQRGDKTRRPAGWMK